MGFRDDLRTAFRSLARRPAFVAVVVLTLGVALGANTAVFSVLQQTVLRPLPYPGAEDAVYIMREAPMGNFQLSPKLERVRAWREHAETVTAVEAFDGDRVTLLGRGEPRELTGASITPGLFGFLGVSPALGRGFAAGEGGSDGEVILSDALWRDLFGGDPKALGETLRLGEETYTVVGVMGRGFRFIPPVDAELWMPFPHHPERPLSGVTLARLAPGVGPKAVEEELLAYERHLATEEGAGEDEALWKPRVRGLGFLFGEELGRSVLVLQAAVALMLLIACANVGNLFLIRAEGRSREIAVRTALGARRSRVVRTLLLESGILAGAGAFVGLAVAGWGGGLIAGLYEGRRVELEALRLDAGVFGFTAAATVVAALAFGLVPALTASRADLGGALKAGVGGAGGGSGARTRSLMVVVEVALAIVLLVGAGLLTKSFVRLVTTDPGFEPESLVTVSMELPEERYREQDRQEAFVRELRDGLEGSGLEETSLSSTVPFVASIYFGSNLQVEGRGPLPEGLVDMVSMVKADPGYFRTLRIPFLAGGAFGEEAIRAEGAEERDIVVNRNLADALWPEGNALGGRLKLGASEDEPWLRVAGIVGDVAQLGISSMHDTFQMYLPLRHSPLLSVVVRVDGVAPELVGDRVGAVVRSVDPWLPVPRAKQAEELVAGSLARERFQMALMLAFAGIALALTGLGVYAVLAYAVRLRAFEIGVRSALGARPDQVLGLVARQGAFLVGIGLALGVAASIVLGRVVESQLHGVTADDPAVVAAAVAVLGVITAAATLVPARRAARLDPVRVLRGE